MSQYKPVSLPSIERIDTSAGRRYKTPEGKLFPSVTTVLSSIPNKYLDSWKERVGDESVKIASRAAKRGTYIHEQCEHLLKGTRAPENPYSKMLHWDMWKTFEPVVKKIGDVYAIEAPLYSNKWAVAGTVDCVGMWEGKLSIIDFKTSSRRKSHTDIDNYFIQTSCYAEMWKEITGNAIEDLVILMAVEDDSPLIFKDQRSNWIDKFREVRVQYKLNKGE